MIWDLGNHSHWWLAQGGLGVGRLQAQLISRVKSQCCRASASQATTGDSDARLLAIPKSSLSEAYPTKQGQTSTSAEHNVKVFRAPQRQLPPRGEEHNGMLDNGIYFEKLFKGPSSHSHRRLAISRSRCPCVTVHPAGSKEDT